MVLSRKSGQQDLSGWGEAGLGVWNPLSPGQSPLPLPATPGEATRGVRGEAGGKEARRRPGAGSPFAVRHKVSQVWLQRPPPPGRQAGSSGALSKVAHHERRRHGHSVPGATGTLWSAQPRTLQIPSLSTKHSRGGGSPQTQGKGPLETGQADPRRIGRREGVLETVSLDL